MVLSSTKHDGSWYSFSVSALCAFTWHQTWSIPVLSKLRASHGAEQARCSDNERATRGLTTHLITNTSGHEGWNVSATCSHSNQLEWWSERGMCVHIGNLSPLNIVCSFPRASESLRHHLWRALIVQAELSERLGAGGRNPDVKILRCSKWTKRGQTDRDQTAIKSQNTTKERLLYLRHLRNRICKWVILLWSEYTKIKHKHLFWAYMSQRVKVPTKNKF